ncbi:MAG: pyridoxal phosphate-dependent aminotransferase [Acidobacteria bacterium]|nr:MAG: pyridoxal phosphate-dependent aminotransferase [Acidobacteriota bacterium]
MPVATLHSHPLDAISLGKIVQIREQLMQAQAAGAKVFRFESGDPSFTPPAHVLEAVHQAGLAGQTHYVPNNGTPALRRALAQKVVSKNGIAGATESDIFVTNGAMHALFVVFGSLLDPGDEVILPDPMWTEVAENVRLAGGVVVGVPLRSEDGFQYRPETIARALTARTKAIFLNTPHNPTGSVLARETLQAILDLARQRNLWIVADEAYEDVVYAPATHHSIASLAGPDWERIVSIYSFSKSHAMAGLRVGYLVTRARLLHDRIPKLLRCTINGVNSLGQAAALAAVTGNQEHIPAMRAEYLQRRNLLLDALRDIPGVQPFTPEGTFFLWVSLDPSLYARLGVADADALSRRLAQQGIGSTPGDAFGHSSTDALRFSFSCSTAMVREGGAALRRALLG